MGKINDFIKRKILAKNYKQKITILNKKNIFVFPNFKGFQIGFLVLFCFTASIFYQINFSLLLSIVIFIIFFISIIISFQNLNNLSINSYNHFMAASKEGKIHLNIKNYSTNDKLNINLKIDDLTITNYKSIRTSIKSSISYTYPKRGTYGLPTINIFSQFPFGIVKSSSYLKLDYKAIIYPNPELPSKKILNLHSLDNLNNSNYEFDNIDDYEHGESQSRIAWKQSMAKDKLLSKKFINESKVSNILIDIDKIEAISFEKRLSYAAYLVLKSYKEKIDFSLKHKNFILPFLSSMENKNKALTYLANVKN